MRAATAAFDDFFKLDIRVATVTAAEPNPNAARPAYVLTLDCGPELGTMVSSAQLTEAYQPADLVGKRVLAVVNFPPKRVAGVKSEALVLGVYSGAGKGPVVLVTPDDHPAITPGDRMG